MEDSLIWSDQSRRFQMQEVSSSQSLSRVTDSKAWRPISIPLIAFVICQYTSSAALCLYVIYDICNSKRRCAHGDRKQRWTWNSGVALATQTAICAFLFTQLGATIEDGSVVGQNADTLGTTVSALLASVAAFITIARHSTSTARGLYHLSASVTTYMLHHSNTGKAFEDTLALLLPVLYLLAFLLDLQAPFNRSTSEFPFKDLSFFQSLTFSWVNPIIEAASKASLGRSVLWQVDEDSSVQASLHQVLRTAFRTTDDYPNFPSYLLRAYKWPLLGSGALELLNTMCRLVQPWLLKKFLAEQSATVVGYMIFTRLVAAVCSNYSLYMVRIISTAIKASLTSLVFEATLDLPTASRRSDLMPANLAEVDTQRIVEFIPSIHNTWSLPLQTVVAIACVTLTIGWRGILIACIIMVLSYPIVYLQSLRLQTGLLSLMGRKDARTTLTTEVLEKMTAIKLYGYQSFFQDCLDKARTHELSLLNTLARQQTVIYGILGAVPELMTGAAFGSVYYWHGVLSPETIFPTLGYFIILKSAFPSLSGVLTQYLTCLASFKRISEYLLLGRKGGMMILYERTKTQPPGVCVHRGGFGFPNKSALAIGLELDLSSPCLVTLSGPNGSGKSLIIQSLMGFIKPIDGEIITHGSMAYAPQVPWLINGTVRENILFFRPFKPELYKLVLNACSLTRDIEALPDGDLTNLLGVGVSLSGGQMSRISLARALYSEADLVFLDDPLAAIDAKVKLNIVRRVFGPRGLLCRSICVAVSEDPAVVRLANYQIRIQNDRIIRVSCHSHRSEDVQENVSVPQENGNPDVLLTASENSVHCTGSAKVTTNVIEHAIAHIDDEANAENPKHGASEDVSQDSGWHGYRVWLGMARPIGWALVALLITASRLSSGLSTYALKRLAQDTDGTALYYLIGFTLIGLGQALCSAAFLVVTYHFCLIPAARRIHLRLVRSIVNTPIDFFDKIPMGKILNLFTNDLSKIDGTLASNFLGVLMLGANLALILIVLLIPSPGMTLFLIPLGLVYIRLQSRYLRAACQLRRLELNTRSPIINATQEAWKGYQSVVAFGQRNPFLKRQYQMVNDNISITMTVYALEAWLMLRLDVIGTLVQVLTAMFLLYLRTDRSQAGFVMNYAMQTTVMLQGIVRYSTNLALDIISVDRIEECCLSADTSRRRLATLTPPEDWPEQGSVSIKNFSASYKEADQPCLDGVSIEVRAYQKIAIVGRTGSGKSSLALALLGVIGASGGCIEVDGIDISLLDPDILRSKIAVVPQSAPVFSGSIRQNLDPNSHFDDAQLRKAIERCGLDSVLKVEGDLLDFEIEKNCDNISRGQMQLIAFARALLLDRKILILDEATAAIDKETESIVQNLLLTELAECTVFAIVHRLERINDYDRVLVLDAGKVVGFANPDDLLKDNNSLFSRLVSASSDGNTDR